MDFVARIARPRDGAARGQRAGRRVDGQQVQAERAGHRSVSWADERRIRHADRRRSSTSTTAAATSCATSRSTCRPAQCTTLLGRNGVGKTTLLQVPRWAAAGALGRRSASTAPTSPRLPPYARARLGLGYVPQGREIFPRLTVEENLQDRASRRKSAARRIPQRIFEMFPVLEDMLGRRGGDLSGGQQQQLAIGRALAMRPKLLILDEPTEGIQPSIIKDIERAIRKLAAERRDGDPAGRAVLRFREVARRSLRRAVARRSGQGRARAPTWTPTACVPA